MPNTYELQDARFVQYYDTESAADALYWVLGPVPTGKLWSLRAVAYNPNVTETRTVKFSIIPRGSGEYVMISRPLNISLGSSDRLPVFAEGMELVLYQGEQLRITRDAATAGSTMRIRAIYIETDIPFYTEVDQHKELRRKTSSPVEFLRRRALASVGRAPAPGPSTGGRGGRGSGTAP